MDDTDDLSAARQSLIASLDIPWNAYEQYLPALQYTPDPLVEIVERNLVAGFEQETPAVIDDISAQFADVLEMAQWAGFVDDGASLDSLAEAFDTYSEGSESAEGMAPPTETATKLLSVVAMHLRRARSFLAPNSDAREIPISVKFRVQIGEQRKFPIALGFRASAASAALWLVIARTEIYGAYSARQQRVKPAADARRVAAEAKRAQALAAAAEMKRCNPHLSKADIAVKLVERQIYNSISTARDVLIESHKKPTDDSPRRDDDSPRRNDDTL